MTARQEAPAMTTTPDDIRAERQHVRECAEMLIEYTGPNAPEKPDYDPILCGLVLARWALSVMDGERADDAESVTEEWLLSLGFGPRPCCGSMALAINDEFYLDGIGGNIDIFTVPGREMNDPQIELRNVTTRRDVRDLARMLGIELREP